MGPSVAVVEQTCSTGNNSKETNKSFVELAASALIRPRLRVTAPLVADKLYSSCHAKLRKTDQLSWPFNIVLLTPVSEPENSHGSLELKTGMQEVRQHGNLDKKYAIQRSLTSCNSCDSTKT